MSKSSINFQTAKGNSSAHMSRDSFVSYLIEHDNNHFEYKHYQNPKEYLELAQVQTKLLTKRSMQSSAIKNFTQEAVLNIKKDTTIQDVENLFKKFSETKFKVQKAGGFKVFEIALHKDEGVFVDTKYDVEDLVFDSKTLKIYKDGIDVSDEVIAFAPNKDIFYNKDTKKWYKEKDFKTEIDTSKLQKKMNYHAHISFTKWDELTGKNIRLQKSDLQQIQTITAREMKMERGEENSQTKRLNHYQIKKIQAEVNSQKIEHRELKLVTVPQLQTDNINLKNELEKLKELQKQERAELQKQGAVRSDYAALEQKHRDEKQQLELQISNLTATAAVADRVNKELKDTQKSYYADLEAIYETLPASAKKEVDANEKSIDQAKEVSKQAISALQATIPLQEENESLKERLSVLRADMRVLNASLIESRAEVQEKDKTIQKTETSKKHLEEQIKAFDKDQSKPWFSRLIAYVNDINTRLKATLKENTELKKENQEYKALVSEQLKEIANPKQDPNTLTFEQKKEVYEKINMCNGKLSTAYEGYSKADYFQEIKKEVYEKFNIDTNIQISELSTICKPKVLTKEDLQRIQQSTKSQSSGYDLSR